MGLAMARKRLFRLTAFRLAMVVVALCIGLRLGGLERGSILEAAEHALGDLRFKERFWLAERGGATLAPRRVVIIADDEKSNRRFGLWPFPRRVYARMIDRLTEAGAKAVVFDVAFVDQDRSGSWAALQETPDAGPGTAAEPSPADRALAEAIKRSGKTVQALILLNEAEAHPYSVPERSANLELVGKSAISEPRIQEAGRGSRLLPSPKARLPSFSMVLAPIGEIAAAATWLGTFNASPDDDGSIRSAPLASRVVDPARPDDPASGRVLPSLDLAAAALICDTPAPFVTPITDDEGQPVELWMPCGKQDLRIPVGRAGHMTLNYTVPWSHYPRLSAVDVFDGAFDPAAVRDRVALIAAISQGSHDLRSTPLDGTVPGGVTHAAALESILNRDFLHHTPSVDTLEFFLLLAFGVVFGALFARLRPLLAFVVLGAALAFSLLLDLTLFLQGLDLASALRPLELVLMFPVALVFRYLTEERKKRSIRDAFRHYLTPSVMEQVLADPGLLKLGGEKRELTVLFSDIRGFTSVSEQLPPERLVNLLNGYLQPMTDIVFHNGGTLDKYIGDAIMAFFGAPLEQTDHALRACRTACEMRAKLEELRAGWRAEGLPELDFGLGLNTGPMVVGNMGSHARFDYTVMGDAVNLGSRLEGLNKAYQTQLLLSEFTYRKVAGEVTVRELDWVRVQGRAQPVTIYELIAMGPPSGEWRAALAAFAEGLRSYRAAAWDAAGRAFAQVLVLRPDDAPARVFAARCVAMKAHPPAPGWDGVFDALMK
jgi:adenylate cyclase